MVLDCKMELDDNALFRQPKLAALEDAHEVDPRELCASAAGLAYISLDGDIGCMVNGAGLAMATMDAIGLAGGRPANFLDVGGSADKQRVSKAFKLILEDEQVKAVLVNIFGGIMRCDVIAEGIIAAAKEVGLKLPLVVRLKGTNMEEGKALLEASGLSIIPADSLQAAAQTAVAKATQ
jgi:succinyl-CoA synthetase beta subunit